MCEFTERHGESLLGAIYTRLELGFSGLGREQIPKLVISVMTAEVAVATLNAEGNRLRAIILDTEAMDMVRERLGHTSLVRRNGQTLTITRLMYGRPWYDVAVVIEGDTRLDFRVEKVHPF